MKTKERTNKKTKEMLKEDRLTIGCARVYISVRPRKICFQLSTKANTKPRFFLLLWMLCNKMFKQ